MTQTKSPIVALEEWLESLERAYVDIAVRATETPVATGSPTEPDDAVVLDRIEANIARALRAIELCRKHDI